MYNSLHTIYDTPVEVARMQGCHFSHFICVINLCDFATFFRRDAYTVITPDEEKRKTVQESEMNFCLIYFDYVCYCINRLYLLMLCLFSLI